MPRPKKNAEPKVPAPVAVAPPQQPMMPTGVPPQGPPPVLAHQQFQQVLPNQLQHLPPPMPQPAGLAGGAPRVVLNEHFLSVRDSAVGRLTTILELLRNFTADYLRQTNLLLGEPTPEGTSQNDILAGFENTTAQLLMPAPPVEAPAPAAEEKKERKKRTHDPNAPKRPLTPYFLYMQHARSIIANDLGAEARKGAVQEEGQRRWAQMGPHEKQGWNNAYQYNLRLYNAKVHSYKAGNPNAKNMSDEEALKYADDNSVPLPELKDAHAQAGGAPDDQDAIAEQLQQVADAPEIGDDGEAKTPKKVGARKRKSEPAQEAATPASPDKKRRRASAKGTAEVTEEPKKSARKKAKNA